MELESSETAEKIHLMESHRLDSFKIWPFTAENNCNIKSMAEAGFYYCGTENDSDSAACFCCGKVLNGWESTDIPIDEHRKHAPQCFFVKIGKFEKDLTVEEFLRVFQASITGGISRKIVKTRIKIRSACHKFRNEFYKKF
ncbi:BIRC5 family protein [Megaselia abdita]